MKVFVLVVLLGASLLLAACTGAALASRPVPTSPVLSATADLTRVDQQGMVMVEVTPVELTATAPQLQFDVAMNTHSVDLSMDLAALSTLTTDTGSTLQATKWEATPGGHHVSGRLVFPASKDGRSILDGASKLTLTIINVDATARVFEWPLK